MRVSAGINRRRGDMVGHESPITTHQYTHANLEMKERALAKLQEPDAKLRQYKASDSLISFLKKLQLWKVVGRAVRAVQQSPCALAEHQVSIMLAFP